MSYSIEILRRAQKEMAQLPRQECEWIKEAVLKLSDDPRPQGCKKPVGREGWRIRVGDYRVIYEIDDTKQTVTVLHVGHRRDVYDYPGSARRWRACLTGQDLRAFYRFRFASPARGPRALPG